jgi:hypothetical protein
MEPDQGDEAVADLKVIEQSNALLAVLSAASAKLKDFYAGHDKADENFREKAKELERAMWSAHSKWLRFAELNFFDKGQ